MAHSHAHGEPEAGYFTDQLVRVIEVTLLGLVAVLMFRQGTLAFILTKSFWLPVALAGGAILLMALIRLAALFGQAREARTVAETPKASHSHGGEECAADHGHTHAHAHSHSHRAAEATQEASHGVHDDHGSAPWKYIILAIPAALFFLDLPNNGFSADRFKSDLSTGAVAVQRLPRNLAGALGGSPIVFMKNTTPIPLRFNELSLMARSDRQRKQSTGRVGVLKGQFQPVGERDFTLYRLKMSCCASDAVPLEVRIICEFSGKTINEFKPGEWVEVEGEIQFAPHPEREGEYLPLLIVSELAKVRAIEKPADLYEGS